MRVDPLPSRPADGLDAALGEQVRDVAVVRPARSGARPRRPRAGCSPPPARPSCSCRSPRSGRGGSSPSRTRRSRGARRRRRGRRRSGSCRGARRRGPRGSRCPCSRSSAARGRSRCVSRSPVGRAASEPSSRGSSRLRSTTMRSTRSSPCSSTGEVQEPQHDPLRLPGGLARRVLAQDPHVLARRLVGLVGVEPCLRRLVQLEVRRVDDHVRLLELAELQQLGVREGRLRRSAAAEDHDLLDGVGGQQRRSRGRPCRSCAARRRSAPASARSRSRRCRCRRRRPARNRRGRTRGPG